MDIEFFQKKDFGSNGDAVIKFTGCGAVIINACAMKQLGLSSGKRVCVGYDKRSCADFVISISSEEGWEVRVGNHGEGIFNSVGLVRRVVDDSWGKKSHVPGENKPRSISFRIARLPVDDGKNKNVYALLRKKE